MSVRRVSVGHKLPYNILDKLHAVSPGFIPFSLFLRPSLSLSLLFSLPLFRCLSCSHLLLQLVSEILRFHKTSLLAACFFSCHRMSSFLLFLRLSTAFEFDETFPVVPHASRSLSLPTLPSPPFPSSFFLLDAFFSFFRFLFIHIVGVTRAIQRNLVFPRRLFPSVAARNCRSRDSLESRKNASVLPSILQHHLSRSGYNSAEHLPPGFHCSPFFRFARLPSTYMKNNSSSNLFFLASRTHQIP